MPQFDDRERAFENKFAHDAEMTFKAEARRNKLLGLWAAGLLGKAGAEAEDYAKSVVMADLARPGDEDVFEKVMADLEAAGAQVTPEALRGRMTMLLAEAKAQLMSELPQD
jgi:hypothetical protein